MMEIYAIVFIDFIKCDTMKEICFIEQNAFVKRTGGDMKMMKKLKYCLFICLGACVMFGCTLFDSILEDPDDNKPGNPELPTSSVSTDVSSVTTKVTTSTAIVTNTVPDTTFPADEVGKLSYEYDNLGRLVKVVHDEKNYIEYEYDANGNITKIINVVDGKKTSEN
ncbi:RHS repeat domain-containing protein [Ruminococcus flavefaciens]|uniref:RHS repeat domain-containing protein n=1 Tax=Ruminococcus flavefaciens TaxID=1265 RepID=UPI0026ECA675|nr:RHS repeat domain-containing protein [Ruminococcus flavefaciens]